MTRNCLLRRFVPFVGLPLLAVLFLLAGCNIQADVTVRPDQGKSSIEANEAEVIPTVSASPTSTVRITMTTGAYYLPSGLSDFGWRKYFGARNTFADSDVAKQLRETDFEFAVVRPRADVAGVLPPTSLLSATLYFLTDTVPAPDVGATAPMTCAGGGLLTMVMPPINVRQPFPLSVQRPMQRTCAVQKPSNPDEQAKVIKQICPKSGDCSQYVIDFVLRPDAGGTLFTSTDPIAPGGEGRPPYCGAVCPDGGGACVLIGCP